MIPKPSWPNHFRIFAHAGLQVREYRYLDFQTKTLDFSGLMEDLCKAPEKSIILLHACAHNPTGVDPSPIEWQQISAMIKARKCFVFFDVAYQGFASGDLDTDAIPIHIFLKDCHQFFAAQCFSKNMGLYGERVGCLIMVCSDKQEADAILSQMKSKVRGIYSTPPINGARIASEILNNPNLYEEWLIDLKKMSCRIRNVRQLLKQNLNTLGSTLNWDHITNQIGMFCYSGLSKKQVDILQKDFHIYMTADGRISMAGVACQNVQYLAESIHYVTMEKKS